MTSDDQPFRAVLGALTLIVMPIGVFFRVRSQSTGEALDRRQEGAFILLTLRPVGLATMAGLLAFLINPSWMAWSSIELPSWLRWLGIALWMPASILLVWAFRSLGKNLTDTVVTRRNHTLVTHGPYRWVRHPFYVAVAAIVIGSALAAANWFVLAGGFTSFALIVLRTSREEDRLLDRFGDEYRAYKERTPRFIPRLW